MLPNGHQLFLGARRRRFCGGYARKARGETASRSRFLQVTFVRSSVTRCHLGTSKSVRPQQGIMPVPVGGQAWTDSGIILLVPSVHQFDLTCSEAAVEVASLVGCGVDQLVGLQ